jgi:glucose-6-phosphate 1-dehydrogenase
MARRGRLTMPVIGVAKSGWTLDQLRRRAEESVERYSGIDRAAFDCLIRALAYIDGDYADHTTFQQLGAALGPSERPAHYLAVPQVAGEALRGAEKELTVSETTDPTDLSAYEELPTDAVNGVSARFARQNYVEEAWRIVDTVLDGTTPMYEYEPGTWGPAEAHTRVAPDGGWLNPR